MNNHLSKSIKLFTSHYQIFKIHPSLIKLNFYQFTSNNKDSNKFTSSSSSQFNKKVQSLNNKINNKSQQNLNINNQNEQPLFTPEQQSLIKSYQPDQVFNSILSLDPKHNLQRDLIVAKKNYQRTTKQLRASILFQDLLKSQVQIPIYDTKGKPYTHMWMKNLFNIFFFGVTVWFFNSLADADPKNKVMLQRTTGGKAIKYLMYGFAFWFMLVGFFRYLKFQRRFVQKIIYDTKEQKFILLKRGFFGGKKEKQISRFKLVYTENEFLNMKGTNYFNIDTTQQYSIPYKQSWIKQDLFSHLIAQRIKI